VWLTAMYDAAGDFQRGNAALAVALSRSFVEQAGSTLDDDATRQGLASVQWPGRAQLVDLPASDGHPRVTLALDGAHTSKSVECAAQWFVQLVRSLQAESPATRVRCVLLFNCGYGKFPEKLLLAIAQATDAVGSEGSDAGRVHFEHAVFAPFDFGKPTRAAPPTAAELVALLPTKYQTGAAALPAADASLPCPFQRALAQTWSVLARSHNPDCDVGTTVLPSMRDAVVAVAPQAHVQPRPRSGSLNESNPVGLDEATEAGGVTAKRDADSPVAGTVPRFNSDDHVVVFGTGSLYLVGNVLEALGWDVDRNGFGTKATVSLSSHK